MKAVLFGRELSHSISDAVHREIFPIIASRLRYDSAPMLYSLEEVPSEAEFKLRVLEMAHLGITGANVTYPYKGTSFLISKTHVGPSSAIRSANTLRYTANGIDCTSTDGQGYITALKRSYPNLDPDQYHLVMLGSGETAKAIMYSLCTQWMPLSLTIVARSIANAQQLAEFCVAEAPGPSVRVMSINEFVNDFPQSRKRMIIQATPVGQINHTGNLAAGFRWDESDLASDLIYNPLQTAFLRSAAASGAKTINGLGMLIEQAALSQVFWLTGLLPKDSPLTFEEFTTIYERLSVLLTA